MSYSGKFKDKNNNLHPVTSVLYGTCDTAAGTAAKVVTCADFDTLMTGVTIRVKFDNANTAASPTVNINSTGAKSVYRFGSTAPVDGNSWTAGEVVELLYDGTSFFMVGADDISVKQNATDNNLDTDAKTIVGAINEHEGDIDTLKSGLTTLDNEVNGDATTYPYADVITIEDAVPANVADCSVKIEPDQNLHGYDHPWVGGAGKNKLPLTVANLKSANTAGTWNDNTYTVNGLTFTILTDDGDNVVGIKVTGTASAQTVFRAGTYTPTAETSVKFNGITGTGSGSTYSINMQIGSAFAGEVYSGDSVAHTIPANTNAIYLCVLYSGYECPTAGLMFYPMIRLSTETDATFAPYENICPISGHTEASVQRDGKNYCEPNNYVSDDKDGTTYTDPAANGNITKAITLDAGTYKFSIKLLSRPNTDRSISFGTSQYGGQLWGLNHFNKLTVGQVYSSTVTLENETTFEGYLYGSGGGTFKLQMQIERGSTPTAYTPYVTPHTATIALGDTIYGGTVRIDSNGNTVMDVDRAKYTATWGDGTGATVFGTSTRKIFTPSVVPVLGGTEQAFASISNIAEYREGSWTEQNAIKFMLTDDGNIALWLPTDTDNNTEVEFCYYLATPTTIQLTPQQIQLLKGTNTITASTGQISVTVNGVSGSIGAVQEQVNELADRAIHSKEVSLDGVELNIHVGDIWYQNVTVTLPTGACIIGVSYGTQFEPDVIPYVQSTNAVILICASTKTISNKVMTVYYANIA